MLLSLLGVYYVLKKNNFKTDCFSCKKEEPPASSEDLAQDRTTEKKVPSEEVETKVSTEVGDDDQGKKEVPQEASKVILINVLDETTFKDCHITGSINVPLEKMTEYLNSLDNKNDTLVFYCSNLYCQASHDAAKEALEKGYKRVYVYSGGMADWFQASKEDKSFSFEGEAKESYLEFIISPLEVKNEDGENSFDEKGTGTSGKIKVIAKNDLQKLLKEGTI